MGVVYKARHLRLKRTVALKVIRAEGPGAAARLMAEAIARLGREEKRVPLSTDGSAA